MRKQQESREVKYALFNARGNLYVVPMALPVGCTDLKPYNEKAIERVRYSVPIGGFRHLGWFESLTQFQTESL